MNLASLWDLPTVFVIENNKWGMGTHQQRALCMDHLAADMAPAYGIKGYTFDGMDFAALWAGFSHVRKETLETGRPVLIEVVTERFKGHSVSDPALYRSKDELKRAQAHDPIQTFRNELESIGILDEEEFKALDKKNREIAIEAMKFADESPWPDPVTLEEDVLC